MRANTRLAGHGMRFEGKALYDKDGKPTFKGWRIDRWISVGMTECECGERSPVLTSDRQRKDWHRDHKAEVRAKQKLHQANIDFVMVGDTVHVRGGRQRIYFSRTYEIRVIDAWSPRVICVTNGDWIEVENGVIVDWGTGG